MVNSTPGDGCIASAWELQNIMQVYTTQRSSPCKYIHTHKLLVFLLKPLNETVLPCKLYEEQKPTLLDSFFVDHNVA